MDNEKNNNRLRFPKWAKRKISKKDNDIIIKIKAELENKD